MLIVPRIVEAQGTTQVLISADVEASSVTINGVLQSERTPLVVELAPGDHVVVVSSGTLEWRQVVTVTVTATGAPQKIFAELASTSGPASPTATTPAPPTRVNRSGVDLYLDMERSAYSKPTRVYVDGIEMEGVSGGGQIVLEPGEHLIAAHFTGGVISERKYVVEPGRIDRVHLKLTDQTTKLTSLQSLVKVENESSAQSDVAIGALCVGAGVLLVVLLVSLDSDSSMDSYARPMVRF